MDLSTTKLVIVVVSVTLLMLISGSASRYFSSNYPSEIDKSKRTDFLHKHKLYDSEVPNIKKQAQKYKKNSLKQKDLISSPDRDCKTLSFLEDVTCEICDYIVSHVKDLVARGSTQEAVVWFARFVCIEFKIEDDRVCSTIVEEFKVGCLYYLCPCKSIC